MSHARRDAKGEKSSDYTIEEQVVLRVPPAIADAVRAILSGKERDLSFVMDTERKGRFTIDGKEYPATLVDLPCVVESWKSLDRRTFYKSADVHQMLLVEDPNAPGPAEGGDKFKPTFDAQWRLDTGLTRLTRHIRTKRWRRHPTFDPKEVEKVADDLIKMKRGAPVPDKFELVEIKEPAPVTVVARPAATASLVSGTKAHGSTPVAMGAQKAPTEGGSAPHTVSFKSTASASAASQVGMSSPIATISSASTAPTGTPTGRATLKLSVTLSPPATASASPLSSASPAVTSTASPLPLPSGTPSTPSGAAPGVVKFRFKPKVSDPSAASPTAAPSAFAPAAGSPPPATSQSISPSPAAALSTPIAPPQLSAASTVPSTLLQPVPLSVSPTPIGAIPTPSPSFPSTATPVPGMQNPNAMAVDLPSTAVESSAPVPSAPSSSVEYDTLIAQRTALATQKVTLEAQLAKETITAQAEKNMMMKKRIQQSITTTQAKLKALEEQLAEIDSSLQRLS